jgi:hypothetical protein
MDFVCISSGFTVHQRREDRKKKRFAKVERCQIVELHSKQWHQNGILGYLLRTPYIVRIK